MWGTFRIRWRRGWVSSRKPLVQQCQRVFDRTLGVQQRPAEHVVTYVNSADPDFVEARGNGQELARQVRPFGDLYVTARKRGRQRPRIAMTGVHGGRCQGRQQSEQVVDLE